METFGERITRNIIDLEMKRAGVILRRSSLCSGLRKAVDRPLQFILQWLEGDRLNI
jgi:hypothetical protein